MKKLQKLLSVALLLGILLSVSAFPAGAKTVIDGNDWYGDEIQVDVTAGTEGYNYMVLFRKPVHGYEFSGHFIGGGEGAQTFVVIDTAQYDGTTWTPSGIFELGVSNYDVMYCCDVETMVQDGVYYKRLNLEDSEYYTQEQARKIRAIVSDSYPYVSLEEMKAALKADGFAYADELERSEIISAVQAAIWASANGMSAEDFRYVQTFRVSDNLQWGHPMHDISNEAGYDVSGKRKFATYEEVGIRHDALVDYLLALPGREADEGQTVITNVDIVRSEIADQAGKYKVTLNVQLNHAADADDDIAIKAYIGQTEVASVQAGAEKAYALELEAAANDNIRLVVCGVQNLEKGVYFYAPRPADVDGDGIATSREVSQNLVGVSLGQTPVYMEKNYTVDIVNADLEINKVDENGAPLTGSQFTLYTGSGDPVATKAVDENGRLVFAGLIPGKYLLQETDAPLGYDISEQTVELTVHEDGSVTFGTEHLEGNKLSGDPVVLEGVDAPGPDATVGLIPGETAEAVGQSVVTENAAKTVIAVRRTTAAMTEVEITEDSPVQDENGNGVTAAINGGTFAENMYLTVGREVSEGVYQASVGFTVGAELNAEDDLTVALSYEDADGKTQTARIKLTGEDAQAAENGVYTVDGLTVRAGQAFGLRLNIQGSLAGTGEAVAVNVTKSASVTLTVEDCVEVSYNRYGHSVQIVNYPEISISVSKIWNDSNDQAGMRPDSVTIKLLANGEEVAEAVLTGEEDWTWTFTDLPAYANGEKITYTVAEDGTQGYTVEIAGSAADGFEVTNTYHEDAESGKPGDGTAMVAAIGIMSLAAAAALILNRKRMTAA